MDVAVLDVAGAAPGGEPVVLAPSETKPAKTGYLRVVLSSRAQLLIGTFLLFNSLLFVLIIQLPWFGWIHEQLLEVGAVAFTALTVLGSLPFIVTAIREAGLSWTRQEVRPELCTVLVLAGLVFVLVHGLITDFEGLTSSLYYGLPIAVLFLLSLERVAWEWFATKLDSIIGFPFSKSSRNEPIFVSLGPPSSSSEKLVSAHELCEGNTLRLDKYSYAPCDVEVEEGKAEITDGALPGLCARRFVEKGDFISGGAKILNGSLKVKVVAAWRDSAVSDLAVLYDEALASDGKFFQRLELWACAAFCFILFFSACAGVYRYRAQESMLTVVGVVSAALGIGVLLRLREFLILLQKAILAAVYRLGVMVSNAASLWHFLRLRSVIIRFSEEDPPGSCGVLAQETLDSRVDIGQLKALIVYLLSRSLDKTHLAVADALRREVHSVVPFDCSEYTVYPGQGVCAVVNGAEISIGSEEFLIARGVYLQPYEVTNQGQDSCLYIAVNNHVGARFILTLPFVTEGKSLLMLVRKLGMRMLLWASHPSTALDEFGKRIGLELSSVRENVPVVDFDHHFSTARPFLLYAHEPLDVRLFGDSDVSCSRFSDMRWNFRESDAVFLRGDAALIAPLIDLVRGGISLARIICAVVVAAGIIGFLAAVGDVVSAFFTVGVPVALLLACYFVTYVKARRWLNDRSL